jgi:glycosidase
MLVLAGCQAEQNSAPDRTQRNRTDIPVTQRWYYGRPLYEINIREFSSSGDFAGALAHLDDLVELGVGHLVLTPVHPAGKSGHLYAVRDHLAIDPAYGDEEDLHGFLAAAHDRGLRVTLDMVLNHGSIDHVMISGHPDWFARDEDGNFTRQVKPWVEIVDFDFDNPEAQVYLLGVLKHWAGRFDVDGFRCAQASLVPERFWQEALATLKAEQPGLFLLAESPRSSLYDAGFDAIYNPLPKAAMDFCAMDDMAQPRLQDDVWNAFAGSLRADPARSLAVHFLEDHFSPRSARDYRWPHLRSFAALLMTGPGIPQIHGGQEVYWSGPTDLKGRRPIEWQQGNLEVRDMYRDLLQLRETSPALRAGDYVRVPVADNDILVYTRTLGAETVLIAANLTDFQPTFVLADSLGSGPWYEWENGSFSDRDRVLTGNITLDPCAYRAWRRIR